jgi:hypothetical protein
LAGSTTGWLDIRITSAAATRPRTNERPGNTTTATIGELYPTSTFQFKLVATNANGESPASEIVDCDTKVANCNGSEKKRSCLVQ